MFQISNIKEYIKNNKFIYIGVLALYALGFTIGGAYSNFISETAFFESFGTTKDFFGNLMLSKDALNLRELIITDATPVVVISLCGFFLIGLPFILYFIFKSGFTLGFYISFLIKAFSLKGFYLGMFYLIMNILFFLPAILLVSVNSLEFNLYILACVNKKYAVHNSFWGRIAICVFMLVLCLILAVLGTNLKAILLPDIIKFLFSSIL